MVQPRLNHLFLPSSDRLFKRGLTIVAMATCVTTKQILTQSQLTFKTFQSHIYLYISYWQHIRVLILFPSLTTDVFISIFVWMAVFLGSLS